MHMTEAQIDGLIKCAENRARWVESHPKPECDGLTKLQRRVELGKWRLEWLRSLDCAENTRLAWKCGLRTTATNLPRQEPLKRSEAVPGHSESQQ